MSKATMPAPTVTRWRVPITDYDGNQCGESDWKYGAGKGGGLPWWTREHLITTDQAEAYANDRASEALDNLEALQAECEKLRKYLQMLIDQTTPLVPDPDRPEWSRRIQLDEVIAERDQLRAECEQLRKDAARYGWLMQDRHEWPEKVERAIKYQGKAQIDDVIDDAMQGGQP